MIARNGKLRAERRQLELQLRNLESRRAYDVEAQSQMPAVREELDDVSERLQQRLRDEQLLQLTAKTSGVVLPPPYRSRRPSERGEIGVWAGTPLEERNRRCYLETGTLFCLIGDPQRLEAVLVVDQADVEFIRAGQAVTMHFDCLPGTTLTGTIEDVARNDLKFVPHEFAAGRDIAVHTDSPGAPRPQETSYQARVAFDAHDQALVLRARGRAKIVADAQPVGRRFYRLLRRTFQFEL
jgi:putative peptide zinc metalloprotease protein